jgi:SHS2 domain-containing protein
MPGYEFLPHTGDTKFRAHGRSLEEAFAHAALAVTAVITDPEEIEPVEEKTIRIESEDKHALLYDFLEQFLILLDSEDFLLHSVASLQIERKNGMFRLNAEIVGDTDLTKYRTETHIKAVTYQEMEIKEEDDGYMLQVVLDI